MIDIHSHILFGIDDGSKNIKESIEILKQASENGVTDIVLTPHYIKHSKYQCNNKEKENLLNRLKKELKKEKININLYLGNEVFIEEGISELIKTDISTINHSKYILIELPIGSKYQLLEEVLDELEEKGLIPIIAHPERYLCYSKDYSFFEGLKERGCILQANIGSLYGEYGRKAKKTVKELLKRNLIDCFGSDIHHKEQNIYTKNIQKELKKTVKNDRIIKELIIENAKKIIENK